MALSAEDKIEIHELSARYALAMDQGDVKSWIETWSDEGVWEGAFGKYSVQAELRKLLPDLGERVKGKRHLITNCVVDGDGTRATLICYMIIMAAVQTPGVIATALYSDVLIKERGRWKFAHRKLQIDPGFAATVK